MRFFRVLAVVCLGAAAAFGQFVFPSGGGGGFGIGASNPTATSATAVTTLPINITILRLPDTSTLIVQCWSGTGGLTTAPFNPVTVTSLSNPVSSSGLLTSITANFASTANVTCRANSNGGAGPAGTNGATGAQGPIGPQGVQGPAGAFPTVQANTTPPAIPPAGQTAYWSDSVNKVLSSMNDQGIVSHGLISAACDAGSHISGINDDGSFNCTPDSGVPTSGTSILKGDGGGGFANAIAGTDYAAPTTGSTILKGNGAGGFASAASGTDYAPATSGASVLKGNGSGGTASAVFGTDLPGLASANSFSGANTFANTVNITGASSPMPRGTFAALPATCTVGQFYFATDRTAGQNIYACTATNTWTLQAGGGGSAPGGSPQSVQFNQSGSLAGVALNTAPQYQFVAQNGDGTNANAPGLRTIMAQNLGDLQVVRTSATALTVGVNCTNLVPCWVGIGFSKVAIQASATITLVSGSHTPTVDIWVDSGGLIEAAYGGIGVTSGDVSCTGCGSPASFSASVAFPGPDTAHTEIAQWTASVAGSWDATGAQRASIYQSPFTITNGPFLTVTPGVTAFQVGFDTTTLTNPSASKVQTSAGTLTNGHCAQFNATGDVTDSGAACGTGTGGGGATVLSTTAPQHTVGYDASNNYTTSTTSTGTTTLAVNGSAPALVVAPQANSTSFMQVENAAKDTTALGVDATNIGVNIGTAAGAIGTSGNIKLYLNGSKNDGTAIQGLANNSNAGTLSFAGWFATSGALAGSGGVMYGPALSTFGRVAGTTIFSSAAADIGIMCGSNDTNGTANGPCIAINHTNGGMGLGGILGVPATSVTNLLDIFGAAAADGTGNHSSGVLGLNATYWNGTASAKDTWTVQNSPGTGTNPSSTLVFGHSGSSGYQSVLFPGNVIMTHLTQPTGSHDMAGTITVSASTTGSATFGVAYVNEPICTLTPRSDPTAVGAYWVTASTTTVAANVHTSGTITFNYTCVGNPN